MEFREWIGRTRAALVRMPGYYKAFVADTSALVISGGGFRDSLVLAGLFLSSYCRFSGQADQNDTNEN